MFSCKDSISLLMEFLDGEMSPDEEEHLRAHLSGCPPCMDFVSTYRATPSLCKRALARQMPRELSNKLTEYLRAKIKPHS